MLSAQISVVRRQESLAAQAKGSKLECQFVPHTVDGSGMGTVYDLVTDCQVGEQHIPQHRLQLSNGQHTLPRLQMHLSIGSQVFVLGTNKLPNVNNGNTSGRTPSPPQICRIHVTLM